MRVLTSLSVCVKVSVLSHHNFLLHFMVCVLILFSFHFIPLRISFFCVRSKRLVLLYTPSQSGYSLFLHTVKLGQINKTKPLDIYKEDLEAPFLLYTREYYARESSSFIAANGIATYMKKVPQTRIRIRIRICIRIRIRIRTRTCVSAFASECACAKKSIVLPAHDHETPAVSESARYRAAMSHMSTESHQNYNAKVNTRAFINAIKLTR